ncbi:MAG: phytanoyl-CoA dioxygenase family protein [Bdellovibrionia bacterium]
MLKTILSGRKVVENSALNYLGVQVARLLLTSAAYAARGLRGGYQESAESAALRRDGIISFPDFLEEAHFEEVKREFGLAGTAGRFQPIDDGGTRVERHTLAQDEWRKLPAVRSLLEDQRLLGILHAAERRPVEPRDVWFDEIRRGAAPDSQTQMHTDVFFNSHKVWLFLEDVSLDDGPLCYMKGTHRASFQRMVFEYRQSIRFKQLTDYSFRLSQDELRRFPAREVKLVVGANTLVIANTRGFHRRGDALPGRRRKQIHFAVRENPFSLKS